MLALKIPGHLHNYPRVVTRLGTSGPDALILFSPKSPLNESARFCHDCCPTAAYAVSVTYKTLSQYAYHYQQSFIFAPCPPFRAFPHRFRTDARMRLLQLLLNLDINTVHGATAVIGSHCFRQNQRVG